MLERERWLVSWFEVEGAGGEDPPFSWSEREDSADRELRRAKESS